VHTKPHLEIEADDVTCSHGATVGALDEDQLFYLRARGIGEEQARAVLTFGFVRAVVDAIPVPAVSDRLARALLDRLPHGQRLEGLM
jgi:Fe-S cluster assembly protein SufD